MQVREVESGKVLAEQKQNFLYLIAKGAAKASYEGGIYRLQVGDVIGLCEMGRTQPKLTYKIEDKVSLIVYNVSYEQLKKEMEENPQSMKYFVASFFRQFNEICGRCNGLKEDVEEGYQYLKALCEEYTERCAKKGLNAEPVAGYDVLEVPKFGALYPQWMDGYYATQEQMLAVWDHNITDYNFLYGFFSKSVDDIALLLSLCGQMQKYKEALANSFLNERGQGIFHKYMFLYDREVKEHGSLSKDALELKQKIKKIMSFIEQQKAGGIFFSQPIWNEFINAAKEVEILDKNISGTDDLKQQQIDILTGSLDKILAYAECDPQVETNFKKYIQAYKKLADKNGNDESTRIIRHEITSLFYQIYVEAFQASVAKREIPPLLKMFFEFGYVDEELARMDNALYMYQLVSNMQTDPERGVYSVYEWMRAIFEGRKEPGRNEFDQDYTESLREQRKAGKLTADQEAAMINNPASKVLYEMEKVFPLVNKVTFGRPSVFCPVFSAHNVVKPLDTALVTADKICAVLAEIRRSDFSAFYRETMYAEPSKGVPREQISVEVLPDIILTPIVGSRGIMWQEIEGKKRTTPARMMCPIFLMEDLRLILIRLTAEFRWEMCKRIQGARWNDITERSLTSEYCDYVQFYRKSRDLSADAKEKVKTQLVKCKNSYKEMFIFDYMQWICFESMGAQKVNRVVREIMFSYCPFGASNRKMLSINPIYKDLIEKYQIKLGQKLHHLDNLYQKIKNEGKEIPEEIIKYREFIES